MFSYTQGGVIAGGGAGLDNYIRQYGELVKSTVKHPAIFGYAIGNEIFDSVSQNPQFWQNFGKLIDAAHSAGVSQGENPFLITAITDDYTPQFTWPAIKKGEQSGKVKNLDAWGINVYRGPEFGGADNSVFTQYAALLQSLLPPLKKPLILGEWGTPHTTRPSNIYGQSATTPVRNLDDVPERDMGPGRPYFAAVPVATFLNRQWNTIKGNLAAGNDQVCVGGFIFDWADEYWKGNPDNPVPPVVQLGGSKPEFPRKVISRAAMRTKLGSESPVQSINRPMGRASQTFRAHCLRATMRSRRSTTRRLSPAASFITARTTP